MKFLLLCTTVFNDYQLFFNNLFPILGKLKLELFIKLSCVVFYSEMEKIGLVIVTITWWLLQVNAFLGGSPSSCKGIVYLHVDSFNIHVNLHGCVYSILCCNNFNHPIKRALKMFYPQKQQNSYIFNKLHTFSPSDVKYHDFKVSM